MPFPPPGGLPNPGIESRSPTLQVDFYQLSYQGNPYLSAAAASRVPLSSPYLSEGDTIHLIKAKILNFIAQWHPTPVLLPGKSHGRRSLVGCSPWCRQESGTTERFHFHILEKEMATHSSILAWRIPGTEEPGGLPSTGSHRVRHD